VAITEKELGLRNSKCEKRQDAKDATSDWIYLAPACRLVLALLLVSEAMFRWDIKV
jgi:hypothetical protein